jgi:hypothetical protein
LLGFIAVLVHRISLWTSGGTLVMSVTLSSGLDRSEEVPAGLERSTAGGSAARAAVATGNLPLNGFDPLASCVNS